MVGVRNSLVLGTPRGARKQKPFLKNLPEALGKIVKVCKKPLKLFFQDESRFGRISQPLRCWSPVGQRPVVPSQIVREYTYAYAAVCPQDGSLCSLILPDMRTTCLNIFLAELSRRYPDNHLVVVMDGAASHRSKDLDVPKDMSLLRLPPYSPELNPQENVWGVLKKEGFYNRVFDSLDAVEEHLVKVLAWFEQQGGKLQQLTLWNWIRYAI